MKIEQIGIKGQRQDNAVYANPDELWELRSSYLITGAVRGSVENHIEELKSNEVVQVIFEDNTSWLCSNETLTELFPDAILQKRSVDGVFEIPTGLPPAPGEERGFLTNIAIKVINIFVKKGVGLTVRKAAEDLEMKRLGSAAGLFMLNSKFQLMDLVKLQVDKPFLLFLHGTASSTGGAFSEMVNTALWKSIIDTYGANILAYQHQSLTKSPLQNAAELAGLLPNNITLHIISHSRGGLVGDILCRYGNSDDRKRGFTQTELDFLTSKNDEGERTDDLAQIAALTKTFANKNIFIKKFIRVASPAAGTILASKRMDIYFNVIANLAGILTGGSANPFYAAFKNLVSAIIDTKEDTSVLPGIEAMNPDSPFIKVLNNPSTEAPIDGALAVIAGNSDVQLSLKALKAITSKLFFLRDNDLVVNTDSMYLGTRRLGTAQYFFDHGGNVDHFHYFSNSNTIQAIISVLQSKDANEKLPLFLPIEQSSATSESRALLEQGELDSDKVTGTRAIVVLLPGIMGSNIGPKGDPLWINYEKFIKGGLTDLKDPALTATSIVRTSYSRLKDFLSRTFDVVTFPFDWRLPLADAAKLFDDTIGELLKFNQPIKIIGHSMGGVLVRDYIALQAPEKLNTWERLRNSAGFQLIFLGAPLGGSFRIPSVLFGMDPIIKKLGLIDIYHSKKDLLSMFSQMEGLLSLLPNSQEGIYDFGKYDTWTKMRDAFGDSSWPLPPEKLIDNFRIYRDSVQNALTKDDYKNAVYIAGQAKATPLGFVIEEDTNSKELVFLSTAEGDQSVTWDSGIPKLMLETGSVYYVDVTHGALANDPSIFNGIMEILKDGRTDLLSRKRPEVRGVERAFRTPEVHDFNLSARGVEKTLLGLDDEGPKTSIQFPPVALSISNGDLQYASYPLLAGHFEDDGVLFAEKEIDRQLKGVLTKKHRLGLYPGKIGTSEVVFPQDSEFKGAVIAGLGKPGNLNAFLLTITVEQAVAKYLLEVNTQAVPRDKPASGGKTGISSLIIGCGYGGLSVEESAKAIIQGVQNANASASNVLGPNSQLVEVIEFIEKYEDRALQCFYSLSRILLEGSRAFNVSLPEKRIKVTLGSTRRMPHEATEAWWNRITVRNVIQNTSGNSAGTGDNAGAGTDPNPVRCFQFTQSTGGSREDQRQVFSSVNIIDQLVNDISTNNNWSAPLARTIFELVIPNDFKDQLKKQCSINWILDKDTAGYPWEMLQDIASGAKPFSVNSGMIRQLATEDARPIIRTVVTNTALVIAAPELSGFAPALPGAEKEGHLVKDILDKHGVAVTASFKDSVPNTIISLFKDDYKIIHLAGHGVFDPANPARSGMLIGKNVFLSTKEIQQMSTTPELVFVNCCYLNKMNGGAERYYRDRFKLAANIGTQLIENGVKAVIACGWAVNDEAALEFTRIFYESMFAGYNLGDSVLKARRSIYENYPSSNTWGAYQCYGDPFYRLEIRNEEKKWVMPEYVISQEAEYDLYNLLNELEMGKRSTQEYLEQLQDVAEAVDKADIRNAVITEKEALIFMELGDYDSAIARFENLLRMEKADFRFSSMEKYCNVRAKKYVRDYTSKKDKTGNVAGMKKVIEDLAVLVQAGGTAERISLMGSTYKRLAILLTDKKAKQDAYIAAAYYYQKAHNIPGNANRPYTLTNWLIIEYILIRTKQRAWQQRIDGDNGYTIPTKENARIFLTEELKAIADPLENYWTMVAHTNITLTLLMLLQSPDLSKWNQLAKEYLSLWQKAGSPGKKMAEIEHLQFMEDALSMRPTTIDSTTADVFAHLGAYLESVRLALLNDSEMSLQPDPAVPATSDPGTTEPPAATPSPATPEQGVPAPGTPGSPEASAKAPKKSTSKPRKKK